MNVICVVKFVPDVDHFNYDFEKNSLIREGKRLIMNPDDVCAIACALKYKEKWPDTRIQVVTMAPVSVIPYVEDLIRTGVDEAAILSDRDFAGSDTYATGKILSEYLKGQKFDYLFTGTGSLDGDTSHVPAQIAEWLGLQQLSGITGIEQMSADQQTVKVIIDGETAMSVYELEAPAVLSFSREARYRLPYIKRENMYRDVKDSVHLYGRENLNLKKEDVGLAGSRTWVVETYIKNYQKKDSLFVKADEHGVEMVYSFLKDKGILS